MELLGLQLSSNVIKNISGKTRGFYKSCFFSHLVFYNPVKTSFFLNSLSSKLEKCTVVTVCSSVSFYFNTNKQFCNDKTEDSTPDAG